MHTMRYRLLQVILKKMVVCGCLIHTDRMSMMGEGTFVSAPGMNVVSAKADGSQDSLNNGSFTMTGTSMATPMAASFTALLQQMIEDDYGYTPSAPMLRAMLAASAEPFGGNHRPCHQGYGRPSLSFRERILYTILILLKIGLP